MPRTLQEIIDSVDYEHTWDERWPDCYLPVVQPDALIREAYALGFVHGAESAGEIVGSGSATIHVTPEGERILAGLAAPQVKVTLTSSGSGTGRFVRPGAGPGESAAPCPECGGTGWDQGFTRIFCGRCGGTGKV